MKYIILSIPFILACFLCSAQISFTLNQAPCNTAGPDGILTATTTLTPPIDYYWYVNGQVITQSGVNATSSSISNYPGGEVYVSAISSTNSATGSYNGTLPFTYQSTITPISCASPGTAFTTVSGGLAPFTFEYYDLATNTVFSTSNPVTNVPLGLFGVKITDANGCVFGSLYNADSLAMYNGNPFTVIETVNNANCTNGSITINSVTGGTPPYTYLWSNNATTQNLSNLTMGGYVVTITDATNCSGTYNYEVLQAININVFTTPTPATCLSNDGSAIAFGSGGMPPYTYTWQGNINSQSLSNVSSGVYDVVVHDANGCVGYGSAYIGASTPITATYTSTTSLCSAPTGSATLTLSGGTAPYAISWNTSPMQTGNMATNLPAGNYGFTVTDAVGCVQQGLAVISSLYNVNVNASGTNPTCTQLNGSVSTSVFGGTPPYTYLWSNMATSTNLSNVGAGGYLVTVTDANSCTGYSVVQLTASSPISLGVNVTPTSCIYTNDGAINATALGGTPPYTWSGGSATINNLAQGGYGISVTDANGCFKSQFVSVGCSNSSTACYCTINGKVYQDINSNCVQDSGEPGIHNIQIYCQPFGYTYTDANGNYSFKVPSGNYTLSESVLYQYPLASCQSNNNAINVAASAGCTQTVNFANTINPLHDMKINTWSFTPPIPGYSFIQKMVIANMGTVAESNVLGGYKTDGQLNTATFSPGGVFDNTTSNWYENSSSLLNLLPGQQAMYNVQYNVPVNIPLGTNVILKDSCAYQNPMSNWLNDYSPWDNVNYVPTTIVGSWDPNFIEVSPKGDGPNGNIYHKDSILDYVIHFQNLGNYKALNIFILDTLDPDLDWKTLRPVYATHDYDLTISETGVMKVNFPNIDLPPKSWNELASMGLISYTIKRKPNVPIGTQFTNTAGIYFDFNAPVQTNTTLNTLSSPTQTYEQVLEDHLEVYPNPASDKLFVRLTGMEANQLVDLEIRNLSGQVIQRVQKTTSKQQEIITLSCDQLQPGLYFLSMATKNTKQTRKFVKE